MGRQSARINVRLFGRKDDEAVDEAWAQMRWVAYLLIVVAVIFVVVGALSIA